MLELLETIAGAVVLFAYLGVAVVLPTAVIVAFVLLIGTLMRLGIDPLVARIPEVVRTQGILAFAGRILRSVVTWSAGSVVFLSLVGIATGGESGALLADGFGQTVVTLVALQDIVATWISGRVLNDLLVQTQQAPGENPVTSLRLLETLVTSYLHRTLGIGVTLLAFRWTFAAFATAFVAIYVVLEPVRAIRRRLAQLIAGASRPAVIAEESLARQAELIAQAVARAMPQPVAGPAVAVPTWRSAAAAPAVPAATAAGPVASPQRVAVVTWDGALAAELGRQLDGAGFAPLVLRSVAEAFAGRVWPSIVFIDARHLQWLSPERLPLLVRSRLVAVTSAGAAVPRGWQLDTHVVESGADALLELLRKRDQRRRAGSKDA